MAVHLPYSTRNKTFWSKFLIDFGFLQITIKVGMLYGHLVQEFSHIIAVQFCCNALLRVEAFTGFLPRVSAKAGTQRTGSFP